jgi:hypothetical protein
MSPPIGCNSGRHLEFSMRGKCVDTPFMVSPDGFFPERNCVQMKHTSAVIFHRFGLDACEHPIAFGPPSIEFQSGEESPHSKSAFISVD